VIFASFNPAIDYAINTLKTDGNTVDTGKWQGIPTGGKPDLITNEILNLDFSVALERVSWFDSGEEDYAAEIATEIEPSLPWADQHFEERIGGIPRNPDPSHVNWPWWAGQYEWTASDLAGLEAYAPGADALRTPPPGFEFTHTYSERFWPTVDGHPGQVSPRGIRYRFGDYDDLIRLLQREPYTRQAYLPIFFPEDTGAVHGGRIPCSLGYHFLLRQKKLHCWYEIRSCDAVRHFRDDLYLAARLVAYTLSRLFDEELRADGEQLWVDVNPGTLFFSCHSFHVHMGDIHRL
jgi:hypothetical protein